MMNYVSIVIVTWNHADCIVDCLDGALEQSYKNIEILIVDNYSADNTMDVICGYCMERRVGNVRLIQNLTNTGFSAANNLGIGLAQGDWILCLNPDVHLTPDYLSTLIDWANKLEYIGALTGAVYSERGSCKVDSFGLFPLRKGTHIDRYQGMQIPSNGDPLFFEEIFGVSGGLALYSKVALRDVSYKGMIFDNNFFAYAEDADLAWRLRWRGWRSYLIPSALAFHSRHYPGDFPRRNRSAVVNMHLTKNRFLLHLKNYTVGVFARNSLHIVFAYLLLVGYVALREKTSYRAFREIAMVLNFTLAWRSHVLKTRTQSTVSLLKWFDIPSVEEQYNCRESMSPYAHL